MTEPDKQLSLDVGPAHRTPGPVRGKHYVEPRGYAAKPGTGPKGETCGSCKHKTSGFRRRFPKCILTRACWTHARRTDILVGADACEKWEKRDG